MRHVFGPVSPPPPPPTSVRTSLCAQKALLDEAKVRELQRALAPLPLFQSPRGPSRMETPQGAEMINRMRLEWKKGSAKAWHLLCTPRALAHGTKVHDRSDRSARTRVRCTEA